MKYFLMGAATTVAVQKLVTSRTVKRYLRSKFDKTLDSFIAEMATRQRDANVTQIKRDKA